MCDAKYKYGYRVLRIPSNTGVLGKGIHLGGTVVGRAMTRAPTEIQNIFNDGVWQTQSASI